MINEYFDNFFENDLSMNSIQGRITLEEKSNNKDEELKKFQLDCSNYNFKMIKSDKITVNNLFMGKGKGQRKHCDYLLITNDKVYFIELKTTIEDENGEDTDYVLQQFNGTLCITEYIDSVLENFYKKNQFFNRIEKRFIIFCKNHPIPIISTRNLKELRNESNDKPNKFKIIEVENDGVIAIEELG